MDLSNCGIQKDAMYVLIADRLESMILSGSVGSDRRLPSEQSLAVGFGVSRPVIREALKLLCARGLVVQKNGEGSFISSPDSSTVTSMVNRIVKLKSIDILDVYAMRVELETMAVRLACENADANGIAGLRSINKSMSGDDCKTDLDKRAELDIRFHEEIARLGGNQLLDVFVSTMAELLKPVIRRSLELPGVSAGENGIMFHERIIAAIEAGDSQSAEETVREHLIVSLKNYEETVRLNGNAEA